MLIKFKPPGEEQGPTSYLKECIVALTDYLVDKVADRDLVGLRIRNTENVQDKVFGVSFRRHDPLKTWFGMYFRKLFRSMLGLF